MVQTGSWAQSRPAESECLRGRARSLTLVTRGPRESRGTKLGVPRARHPTLWQVRTCSAQHLPRQHRVHSVQWASLVVAPIVSAELCPWHLAK